MSENDASTSSMVYVLIALEQDITTSELAVGAQNASMPEAQTEAPDWFAAAAEAVDVMAMAPELRQYPEGRLAVRIWTSSASTHLRWLESVTTDPGRLQRWLK